MGSDYRFEAVQRIPRSREEVYAFFSDAGNLERLTPSFLRFRILSPQPFPVQPGALIDYSLRLNGIPVRWRTRIETVDPGRGFVLHSADYREEATLDITGGFAMTATIDILRAIGKGEGPRQSLLALGYAGWAPGQLDAEIQANGWLSVDADAGIVFEDAQDRKWQRALAKIGIDLSMLSTEAGRA